MSDPIDFNEFRMSKDIDAEHIRDDGYGRKLYEFLLGYEFEGKSYGGVTVWAYSHEDAEQRVAAMRETLVLYGQLGGIVPA